MHRVSRGGRPRDDRRWTRSGRKSRRRLVELIAAATRRAEITGDVMLAGSRELPPPAGNQIVEVVNRRLDS